MPLPTKKVLYDEETIKMMIDIVGEKLDYKAAGKALAALHPRMFVEMLKEGAKTSNWHDRFFGLRKIAAIKLYREEIIKETGTPPLLRDAKNFVEYTGGYTDNDGYLAKPMS